MMISIARAALAVGTAAFVIAVLLDLVSKLLPDAQLSAIFGG